MFRWIILALALATPATADTPTFTAECLWKALPPATRDRMVTAYARQGSSGPSTVPDPKDLSIFGPCVGPMPKDRTEAGKIGLRLGRLYSVGRIEFSARTVLAARGYSGAALDRSWESLDPSKRTLLRSIGRPGASPTEAKVTAVRLALDELIKGAGYSPAKPDQGLYDSLSDYYRARAIREDMEAY